MNFVNSWHKFQISYHKVVGLYDVTRSLGLLDDLTRILLFFSMTSQEHLLFSMTLPEHLFFLFNVTRTLVLLLNTATVLPYDDARILDLFDIARTFVLHNNTARTLLFFSRTSFLSPSVSPVLLNSFITSLRWPLLPSRCCLVPARGPVALLGSLPRCHCRPRSMALYCPWHTIVRGTVHFVALCSPWHSTARGNL